MRQRVMRIRNSDFGIGSIRLFAADHEGDHSREIGLEGQDLQVEHQLRVFLECGGHAGRPRQRRQVSRTFMLGDLDAPFNVTNRIEVFGNL